MLKHKTHTPAQKAHGKSKKHRKRATTAQHMTPKRKMATGTNFLSDEGPVTTHIPSLLTAPIAPTTPRVAIVGSGPSAMYTAKYILQQAPTTHIHIIDRLYTPYGLVRHGIAPDHPEAKNVMLDFEQSVMKNPNVTFIGGICVDEIDPFSAQQQQHTADAPKPITLKQLYQHYHGVVLATGAQRGRKLGLANEEEKYGVYDAHAFVNWYNGHPDYNTLNPMTHTHANNAIIIGNGNVSLDIARFLLAPNDYHKNTDIPLSVREEKKAHDVNNVYVVARRGVVDASYTIPELREILTLTTKTWSEGVENNNNDDNNNNNEREDKHPQFNYKLQFINASIDPVDHAMYTNTRPIKRKTDLLLEYVAKGQKFIVHGDNEESSTDTLTNTTADVFDIEDIAKKFNQYEKITIFNSKLYQQQLGCNSDMTPITAENDLNANADKTRMTKTLSFVFNAKPDEIILNNEQDVEEQRVSGMSFVLTKKAEEEQKTGEKRVVVKDTTTRFTLPLNINPNDTCNNTMIIKSIGYQTLQLHGAPFNKKKLIYPTDYNGRMLVTNEELTADDATSNPILSTFSRRLANDSNTILNLSSAQYYPEGVIVPDANASATMTTTTTTEEQPTNKALQKNKDLLQALNAQHVPFVYATGWARRGPNGIIGANIGDAKEVATTCVADLKAWSDKLKKINNIQPSETDEALTNLPPLPEPKELWQNVPFYAVTQSHWEKIKKTERGLAPLYYIKSWQAIAPEELTKEVDQRRVENVPSLKFNQWKHFHETCFDKY